MENVSVGRKHGLFLQNKTADQMNRDRIPLIATKYFYKRVLNRELSLFRHDTEINRKSSFIRKQHGSIIIEKNSVQQRKTSQKNPSLTIDIRLLAPKKEHNQTPHSYKKGRIKQKLLQCRKKSLQKKMTNEVPDRISQFSKNEEFTITTEITTSTFKIGFIYFRHFWGFQMHSE